MLKHVLLFILIFSAPYLLKAQTDKSVKTVLPYDQFFKIRGGLPNFYRAAYIDKKAAVTFLGGSITYNPGWRQKVCAYLKERFPETEFHFIAAGIPSLGSLPHAFRLQRDVLDSGKVDLLFVEAAVNDRVNGTDSLTQIRDLEGIVRHVKKVNSSTDIVMMEFADPDKNKDYSKEITPTEITNHEQVAGYYHLPSINLAKEVYEKLQNHEFSWEHDFKDLHPAPFGQELYFENIKSLLEACINNIKTKARHSKALPKPLNKASFVNGDYYEITNAKPDNNWVLNKNWIPQDHLETREGFVHIPVISADKPGASLSLPFRGTAIGVAVLSGADAGMITYSIDNGPSKTVDLYTQWSSFLHLPWYILLDGNLANKEHILKITIADSKNMASKGNACRIFNFFINK